MTRVQSIVNTDFAKLAADYRKASSKIDMGIPTLPKDEEAIKTVLDLSDKKGYKTVQELLGLCSTKHYDSDAAKIHAGVKE